MDGAVHQREDERPRAGALDQVWPGLAELVDHHALVGLDLEGEQVREREEAHHDHDGTDETQQLCADVLHLAPAPPSADQSAEVETSHVSNSMLICSSVVSAVSPKAMLKA